MDKSQVIEALNKCHAAMSEYNVVLGKWMASVEENASTQIADLEKRLAESQDQSRQAMPSIDRLTKSLDETKSALTEKSGLLDKRTADLHAALEREANGHVPAATGTETPLLRAAQAAYVALAGSSVDKRAYLRARGWKLGELGWFTDSDAVVVDDVALKTQYLRDVRPFAFLAIKF